MSFAARLAHMSGASRAEDTAIVPEPLERSFARRLASKARWSSPGFARHVYAVGVTGWEPLSPLPASLTEHAVVDRSTLERAVGLVHGHERRAPVFLDLETTGLGSAAHALAFIIGVAHLPEPGRFELVQWTLETPTAERAMLRDVAATLERALGPGSTLVTFNGASFDVPLLAGRLRRLGLAAPVALQQAPHLDLLHVSRRLAGGELPDHRLSTLEREWLGVERVGDLSGAEVARVFEQLVHSSGAPWVRERLAQAQAHNRLDLVTSALLSHRLAQSLERPAGLAAAVRAANHFVRCERLDLASACVQPFLRWSAEPESQGDPAVVRAFAELLRRLGNPDAAARLWAWLCVQCPGDVQAHEALAKDLEHRRRRPEQALVVAEASSAPCARRLARLRRKVARQASTDSARP